MTWRPLREQVAPSWAKSWVRYFANIQGEILDIGLGRRIRNSQWRRRAAAAAANAQCRTPESKAANDVPLEAPGDAPAVLKVKRFAVNEKVKFDSFKLIAFVPISSNHFVIIIMCGNKIFNNNNNNNVRAEFSYGL